jgi:hypothetical protein
MNENQPFLSAPQVSSSATLFAARASELEDLTHSTGYSSSAYVVQDYTQFSRGGQTPAPGSAPFLASVQPRLSESRSIYLAIRAQLPIKKIRRALIDTYFNECNWYFGLLERHYFDTWQAEWDVLDATSSSSTGLSMSCWRFTGLIFQLLAVALQFLEPQAHCTEMLDIVSDTSRVALSRRFSENAVQVFELAGRYGADLVGVHHSLLRAFWLKNAGCGKEAWFSVGESIR